MDKWLALGLAFLSGILVGQVTCMLVDGGLYQSALACFCAVLIMLTARRIGL
jgi:hypothetical protein